MKAILGANPRLIDVWLRLGEVQLELGEVDASIESYKAAIANSGVFSGDLFARLGNVYLQAGRLDEASEAARLAMTGSPDESRTLSARIALARRDAADAETFARALTSESDAVPSDFLLLAEVLIARGDLPGALQAIDEAQRRAQQSGIARVQGLEMQRGDALARSDRPDEAIAALEREIATFPSNRAAYARLAVLYFLTGRAADVDRTLQRLIAANPTPAARKLAEQTRARLRG
ncbi:MAG TPA: tetratricopeptide repeat protein, partial [Thermoanaerobaculia bacterium]